MRNRARAQFIWPSSQNGTAGGVIPSRPPLPGTGTPGRAARAAPYAAGDLGRVRILFGSAPRMYPWCRAYLSSAFSRSLRPAVQPGHDRPDRAVQDLGDLLVGEILEVGQDDDHPVVVGQRVERLLDVVVEHAVEVLGLGIRRLVGVVAPHDPLEGILDLGEIDAARLELLLAVVVDERVLEDLEEPGLQVGAFLELVVVLVGLEVGLLDQVLGVLGAARHAVGRVVERIQIGHHLGIEIPGRHPRRLSLHLRLKVRVFHALLQSQFPCPPRIRGRPEAGSR